MNKYIRASTFLKVKRGNSCTYFTAPTLARYWRSQAAEVEETTDDGRIARSRPPGLTKFPALSMKAASTGTRFNSRPKTAGSTDGVNSTKSERLAAKGGF